MIYLRGFFAALFVWWTFLAVPLSSCRIERNSQNITGESALDADKLNAPLTCFNNYIGVEYTIPKGWWIYDLNTANFSPDRADTADAAMLDIFYGDGFKRMDMARFANTKTAAGKNYFGVYIYAEARENSSSVDEYMPRFEADIQSAADGVCELIDSGRETFDEKIFEKRIFEVSRGKRLFRIMTLSAAAQNGYFLNIVADYHSENRNAKLPPLPLGL